jgi:hypothetical protein
MTTTQIGTEATEREVKQIAENAVEHRIDQLIQPSDIDESATEWQDIDRYDVEKECHESAEVMLKERQEPFGGMVRDYAIILWRDNMPRVNREHLTTDNDRDILVDMGYWPFDMSYFEVYRELNEYINETSSHHIPSTYDRQAKETVETGIVYGMMPDCFGMEIN